MKKNIISLQQKIIAIFIPSSPVDQTLFYENLRCAVDFMPFARLECAKQPLQSPMPFLADKDALQASVFQRLLLANSYDFIWMARGGYGSSRWLSLMDWEKIANEQDLPKVVGFSDVTFIHSALLARGKKTLHAPMLTSLTRINDSSKQAILDYFQDGALPQLSGTVLFSNKSRVKGHLIGGNLTCLAHTVGTAFEPPWDGAILLLEDLNEAPYRIDRCLTHLLESGRLKRLAGIAIGEITGPGLTDELLKNILEDRCKELDIPVIFNLPVGHGVCNMPVLLGEIYTLDAATGCLYAGI